MLPTVWRRVLDTVVKDDVRLGTGAVVTTSMWKQLTNDIRSFCSSSVDLMLMIIKNWVAPSNKENSRPQLMKVYAKLVKIMELINFASSRNLRVKSTMFPHRNFHKYTWTSPDGKTHNQIHHILVDRRRHSNIHYVKSYRAADCDTDHYLVVAKGRD
jgi:hypothetical protein